METETVAESSSAYIPEKKKQENKPEKKPAASRKTETTAKVIKLPVKATAPVKKIAKDSEASRILKIIKRAKNGVDIATLKRKTGIEDKKIRSILYHAFKKGMIERTGRGIYTGKRI